MTDNEIIKALICCCRGIVEDCEKCSNKDICGKTDIVEYILDLINRQKAEIERLEKAIEMVDFIEDLREKQIKRAKAEAITEFAERLKAQSIDIDVSFGYGKEHYTEAVAVVEIDQIAKEMIGE